MALTQKQQDEAARRQLQERGFGHIVIDWLEREARQHIAKQRAIAAGEPEPNPYSELIEDAALAVELYPEDDLERWADGDTASSFPL